METEDCLNWINPTYISGKCGLSPPLVAEGEVWVRDTEDYTLTLFKVYLFFYLSKQAVEYDYFLFMVYYASHLNIDFPCSNTLN